MCSVLTYTTENHIYLFHIDFFHRKNSGSKSNDNEKLN